VNVSFTIAPGGEKNAVHTGGRRGGKIWDGTFLVTDREKVTIPDTSTSPWGMIGQGLGGQNP